MVGESTDYSKVQTGSLCSKTRVQPWGRGVLGVGLPLGSSTLVGLFHMEKTLSLQGFFFIGKSYMGLMLLICTC